MRLWAGRTDVIVALRRVLEPRSAATGPPVTRVVLANPRKRRKSALLLLRAACLLSCHRAREHSVGPLNELQRGAVEVLADSGELGNDGDVEDWAIDMVPVNRSRSNARTVGD